MAKRKDIITIFIIILSLTSLTCIDCINLEEDAGDLVLVNIVSIFSLPIFDD